MNRVNIIGQIGRDYFFINKTQDDKPRWFTSKNDDPIYESVKETKKWMTEATDISFSLELIYE